MLTVQARTVLWYLVFVGFAVNYMIRINLNITIVEMVISKGRRIYHHQPQFMNGEEPANNLSDVKLSKSGQYLVTAVNTTSYVQDWKFSLEKAFLKWSDVSFIGSYTQLFFLLFVFLYDSQF